MGKQRRLKLHDELVAVSGINVYFQPPESLVMEYPCIVYELTPGRKLHADNRLYMQRDCYNVKLIQRDPDTEIPDVLISHFTYISRGARYIADNLYHDTFTLYY